MISWCVRQHSQINECKYRIIQYRLANRQIEQEYEIGKIPEAFEAEKYFVFEYLALGFLYFLICFDQK